MRVVGYVQLVSPGEIIHQDNDHHPTQLLTHVYVVPLTVMVIVSSGHCMVQVS